MHPSGSWWAGSCGISGSTTAVSAGSTRSSTKRAAELYSAVLTLGKVIPMTATAAEVTKTAENTFRDLQIAAINELALYCEAMGINVYDVRAGIDSLKGEGITRAMLWPGAGVGGHCLTKDTYHLERGVQVLGKGTPRLSRQTNRRSTCLPGISTTSCPPTCSGSRWMP